jgi:hypothetical protein
MTLWSGECKQTFWWTIATRAVFTVCFMLGFCLGYIHTLKLEAEYSTKKIVAFHPTTRRYISCTTYKIELLSI